MFRTILLLACMMGLQIQGWTQTYEIPADAQRILFLGNSITYQGTYIEFIDAYLTLKYPNRTFELINAGLPSETVSGLSERGHANGQFRRPDLHDRLARVLEMTQPDLVISNYGMNDGIYKPFNGRRFRKYRAGIEWLDAQVKAAGARIIHVTPPMFDARKDPKYAEVIARYAEWLLNKQETDDWKVMDIHGPMMEELAAERQDDPEFAFAKDGIHPNRAGHFVMAKALIAQLGEQAFADMAEFEAFIASNPQGGEVFEWVKKRQRMMKDAWLSAIGHAHPRMKQGLPLEEAQAKWVEIGAQIEALLQVVE
ncbi:SGNH/GDSL hydrolase family protein [Pontibacter sp. G13]|uniref:SGNH/GDSL hydrolase family protein n=1 Tax=Pontibacter sp. G13 TaxID=3074898 RepID=UPI00288AC14B|nr:SGNH/GDSL hydrolase family protein [Pontibacter sp. G13]WNJ17949.1 SGNH/GDSL hydrolase family protein [Pontibacter sp. G13]